MRSSGPVRILQPICKVRVLTNARVKMPGYLQVFEGELLTLMETENLEPSLCICRRQEEEGRLPLGAIHISQHCWNPYLNLLDELIKHPRLLWLLVTSETVAHDVDLFSAHGLLEQLGVSLCRKEYVDNCNRHLETETFRTETPPMILFSQLLHTEPAMEFQRQFVEFVYAKVQLVEDVWNMQVLCSVLAVSFHQLECMLQVTPANLSLVIKILKASCPAALAASCLFLRFFVPGLAQIGVRSKAMMDVAKALQLVANRASPSLDSPFFCIRHALEVMFDEPVRIFKEAPITWVYHQVDRDLRSESVCLYERLLTIQLHTEEAQTLAPTFANLGSPRSPPAELLEWEQLTKSRVLSFVSSKSPPRGIDQHLV